MKTTIVWSANSWSQRSPVATSRQKRPTVVLSGVISRGRVSMPGPIEEVGSKHQADHGDDVRDYDHVTKSSSLPTIPVIRSVGSMNSGGSSSDATALV